MPSSEKYILNSPPNIDNNYVITQYTLDDDDYSFDVKSIHLIFW